MTATLEATEAQPEVTPVTQVEDLPDPVRADIVARRQAGETLAELKTRFAHVDSAVIQEVLPPANARERKQREAKGKVTEVTQGTGGRSGKTQSEAPKQDAEPKAPPAPRYAEGDEVISLAERALACRQVMGRNALAEALDTTGSAVWRFEQGRIHPAEVKPLQDGLAAVEERIAAGEFVKKERQPKAASPSKADLLHRVEAAVEFVKTARSDKGVAKSALIDSVLALLDPPAEAATETQ